MAMYNEITVTAELTNTEYMITKNYNLLQNKPQINSVELMGNKSLEDLGINPDAEENVIDVVKVNGSALTPDADKAVNVTVTTGSDNGTVKVNGSDVAVKGLKSAAFTEATAYDAAGSAAEVQGNVDALTVVVNGKVDKVQGKGLSQNDFTNSYKSKLDGIEAGAQVNAVTSVAGKTGAVNLQKSDVGLGNVDNTSDLNKPISTATQTALNGKVDKVSGKGLSTNDYTTAEKNKLAGISENAKNVSVEQVVTDGTTLANITIDGVTTPIKGSDIEVDSEPSDTSTNPLQNKAIYDLINNLLPEATASGNPISISDASGFNAKSAKVTMLPIQDLHGQEAPYPAGGGKNKCDAQNPIVLSQARNIGDQPCAISAGTYTFSWTSSANTAISLSLWNGSTQIGTFSSTGSIQGRGNLTFTITENATSLRCYFNGATTVSDIQVESGSTATSYSPYSNICPISGRNSLVLNQSGKNMINPAKAELSSVSIKKWYVSEGFLLKSGVSYSLSSNDSGVNVYFLRKSDNENLKSGVSPQVFTPSEDVVVIFQAYKSDSASNIDLQLELGSTATAYEPYQGETHTATFPSTVYGGEYEFVEAPLKNTWSDKIDLGTLDYAAVVSATSGKSRFITRISDIKRNASSETVPNILCEQLKPITPTQAFNNNDGVTVSATDDLLILYVEKYASGTAEEFKTAMSGVKLCYELATSTTTTLTPQSISLNKGDNVITTDGDNAEVKYSVSLDSLLPT